MRDGAVLRGRGDAGDRRQHFFGDVADDVLYFAPAFGCKQAGEALVLQIAAEQGRDARSGDAEGIAGIAVVGQHEDVAEQFAHRAGLDIAAVGRARIAALAIPISEEFPARRMLHTRYSPRARLGGTYLSRFRARTFP